MHFQRFGNIISWRIMTDKATGRSRGFGNQLLIGKRLVNKKIGFISYDDSMSARQAIEQMNGFQVGTKRLKVQIKQGDDGEGEPSSMGHAGMSNQYRAYQSRRNVECFVWFRSLMFLICTYFSFALVRLLMWMHRQRCLYETIIKALFLVKICIGSIVIRSQTMKQTQ